MNPETFLIVLAFSILLPTVMVAGRMGWCLVVAARERHYPVIVISLAGLLLILVLPAAVFTAWFGYGVAHIEKTRQTDLQVLFLTAPPFYLVALGLWLLAGRMQRKLESLHARTRTPKDAEQ